MARKSKGITVLANFSWRLIHYSLFIILLLLLLASLYPRSGFQKAVWEVGRWPKNPQLHLALAKESSQLHQFSLTQKEISLANSLNPSFVYQNFFLVEELLNEKIQKNKIAKEIKNWEEILKKYPGFRDVYLRLSLLHWQLYNNLMADAYLKKAYLLSPNFAPVSQIKQLFLKNR